uniref:Uncharacterized protein n=1 Tax=Plectus sambesii TaxID=2011161 RepID=A0A914UYF5_9BILA
MSTTAKHYCVMKEFVESGFDATASGCYCTTVLFRLNNLPTTGVNEWAAAAEKARRGKLVSVSIANKISISKQQIGAESAKTFVQVALTANNRAAVSIGRFHECAASIYRTPALAQYSELWRIYPAQ